MNEADDTNASEDRGFAFLVVRMVEPSSTAIESLAPNLRDHVRANIERARRIFRSQTLPSLEPNTRLLALWSGVLKLPSEVDAAILEGVNDKTALAIISLPPADDPISEGSNRPTRIDIAKAGTGDDRRGEMRFAGDLLGKYWYRHQEWDDFDSMKLIDDLKAARERGESGQDILARSKPPKPPRR